MNGIFTENNIKDPQEIKTTSTTRNRSITKYIIDLGMLITSILLFPTGIIKFLNIWGRLDALDNLAAIFSEFHDWSGIILGILVLAHFALNWRWLVQMTKNIFKSKMARRKRVNYLIDIGMLISFLIVFVTGILKFPTFLLITGYFYTVSEEIFILHDWTGLLLTLFALLHVILHWKWIVRMTKKVYRMDRSKIIIEVGAIVGILLILILPSQLSLFSQKHPGDEIVIQGVGTLKFNPNEVQTIRPELFKNGHYSIFDILVDLDNKGIITMNYTFDNNLDTHRIHSINGTTNYWYYAYYDGGWQESNVFRIDHYPYKPKMYIRLFIASPSRVQNIYNTFEEEVQRLNANNGTVILPSVIITSPTNNLHFQNVEVTAHNIRSDFLQDGVITAIDVIMSLGDQGLITYKLNWYNEIGNAEVKNYYVDGINSDIAYGKCGFVYEAGDLNFQGFTGNHIHIPSDIRIITSPEYEEWFWICL
jgi:hypothetical protein